MSEAEQQYMETSQNGHEINDEMNDDLNGAGLEEEGNDAAESAVLDEDSQNGGTEGGQIDASKGEEDAGWVLKAMMSAICGCNDS